MTTKYSYIGGYLNSILGFPIDKTLNDETEKVKKIKDIKSELDIIRLRKVDITQLFENIKNNITEIEKIGYKNINDPNYVSMIIEISQKLKEFNDIIDKFDKNKKINVILYEKKGDDIIIDKSRIVNNINKVQKEIENIDKQKISH